MITLATVSLACPGGQQSQGRSDTAPSAMLSPEHDHSQHKSHSHKKGELHIADDGTRFDPPVPKEKIPNEAWACVMGGKVHYAAMKKGNGECPVCGMNLVQHAAHQK